MMHDLESTGMLKKVFRFVVTAYVMQMAVCIIGFVVILSYIMSTISSRNEQQRKMSSAFDKAFEETRDDMRKNREGMAENRKAMRAEFEAKAAEFRAGFGKNRMTMKEMIATGKKGRSDSLNSLTIKESKDPQSVGKGEGDRFLK